MVNFPTAAQARERGQNNREITEEIMLLELAVTDAIASNALSVEYGEVISDSSATSQTVHGTSITATPMTQNNATGQAWYNVWQGSVTSAVQTEQMNEVINHFQSKGFSISRKSSNSLTFYWSIIW